MTATRSSRQCPTSWPSRITGGAMLEHPPVRVDEPAPRPLCQIRYHNGGYQYCDDQEPSHEDAQQPEQDRTRHNEKQGRKQQQAVRINANWQRSLCRVHGSSLRAVFRAGVLWASVLWGNGLPAGHSRTLSPLSGPLLRAWINRFAALLIYLRRFSTKRASDPRLCISLII